MRVGYDCRSEKGFSKESIQPCDHITDCIRYERKSLRKNYWYKLSEKATKDLISYKQAYRIISLAGAEACKGILYTGN